PIGQNRRFSLIEALDCDDGQTIGGMKVVNPICRGGEIRKLTAEIDEFSLVSVEAPHGGGVGHPDNDEGHSSSNPKRKSDAAPQALDHSNRPSIGSELCRDAIPPVADSDLKRL